MALLFPSEDWLEAFQQALNSDAQYAAAARSWEGDVTFVVEADDGGVVACAHLDLWHGRCRSATFHSGAEGVPQAKFELRGSLQNVLRVLRSEIDPIHAVLTRRVRLKGSLGYVLRSTQAVMEFVRLARSIPTQGTAQQLLEEERSGTSREQSVGPAGSA